MKFVNKKKTETYEYVLLKFENMVTSQVSKVKHLQQEYNENTNTQKKQTKTQERN